jgi:hypothetical protein
VSIFKRDPDRPFTPKPWTDPVPPRPFSRKIFDRPTVTGIATLLVSAAIGVFLPALDLLSILLSVSALTFLVYYCTRDCVRVWHEYRWINSPGPETTLDDL